MITYNSPSTSMAEYSINDEEDQAAFHRTSRCCFLLELLLLDKVPCRRCTGLNFYLVERRTDDRLVWYCRSCYPPNRRTSILGTYRHKLFGVRTGLIVPLADRTSIPSGWDEWDPSSRFERQCL
jgi:hypothetical protein